MNLAIEYLLRNKRVRSLLSLPCSLFLTTTNGHKLVVGIQTSYCDRECCLVKHWKLWESRPEDKLPPFEEFKVKRDEIFNDPAVIIDRCYIMDFNEEPFEAGGKQYSDFPYSTQQEQEYKNVIDRFYNTELHQLRRLNWLWSAFEKVHVPDDLHFHYGRDSENGLKLQREIVQFYSKSIWLTWQYWCKYLLDFNGNAAELVFRREYLPKEPGKIMWNISSYAEIDDWVNI